MSEKKSKKKKVVYESSDDEEVIVLSKKKKKDESNKRLIETIDSDEDEKIDTGYKLYDELKEISENREKIDTSNLLYISKFGKENEKNSILIISLIQHHYFITSGKYLALPYTCKTNVGDKGFKINDINKFPEDLKNILSCFITDISK